MRISCQERKAMSAYFAQSHGAHKDKFNIIMANLIPYFMGRLYILMGLQIGEKPPYTRKLQVFRK